METKLAVLEFGSQAFGGFLSLLSQAGQNWLLAPSEVVLPLLS